jgi:hypothetical protein
MLDCDFRPCSPLILIGSGHFRAMQISDSGRSNIFAGALVS